MYYDEYSTLEELEEMLEADEDDDEESLSPEEIIEVQELIAEKKEQLIAQEKWKITHEQRYLAAVAELQEKLANIWELIPPLVKNSELDPFHYINIGVDNLSNNYDDPDTWNSSDLC